MKLLAAIFLMVLMTTGAVKAEVFVWEDPDFGVMLSYPDQWMRQHSNSPLTRLHILAPAGKDNAQCKLSAEKDGRFKIYPAEYLEDIVKRELAADFWFQHFVNEERVRVNFMSESGGLGRGYATFVDYSYDDVMGKVRQPMRGIAYASIYHDMRVVLKCAVSAPQYGAWYPIFTSIIKSVDFNPKFHPRSWGDYRNFFRDYPIFLPEAQNMGVGAY